MNRLLVLTNDELQLYERFRLVLIEGGRLSYRGLLALADGDGDFIDKLQHHEKLQSKDGYWALADDPMWEAGSNEVRGMGR